MHRKIIFHNPTNMSYVSYLEGQERTQYVQNQYRYRMSKIRNPLITIHVNAKIMDLNNSFILVSFNFHTLYFQAKLLIQSMSEKYLQCILIFTDAVAGVERMVLTARQDRITSLWVLCKFKIWRSLRTTSPFLQL